MSRTIILFSLFLYIQAVCGFLNHANPGRISSHRHMMKLWSHGEKRSPIIQTQLMQKAAASAMLFVSLTTGSPVYVFAKEAPPSIEKCLGAIKKELSPEGKLISQMVADIEKDDWEDLKVFSREYEAGFRGGVMKPAWKQLKGDDKKKGIEITNSFTFDLIALNKASRIADKEDALKRIDQIKDDLRNMESLLANNNNELVSSTQN